VKKLLLLLYALPLLAGYPFGIYYGSAVSPSFLQKFDEIVIDPSNYEDVKDFSNLPYAYISIGEVENYRDYYELVEKKGILGEVNPFWTDSRYVNLESGEWQKFVLKSLIPSILDKGYKALFLDTVDSFEASGQDEKKVVLFINSIKQNFPDIKIMMNRGFAYANSVNVDSVLLESTISTVNLENNSTNMRKEPYIPPIKNKKLYSIDYWDIEDFNGMTKVYKKALELGYIPYVSDFSLLVIPPLLMEDSGRFVIGKIRGDSFMFDEVKNCLFVKGSSTNLRSSPSFGDNIIGRLNKNDSFDKYEKIGEWYKVGDNMFLHSSAVISKSCKE